MRFWMTPFCAILLFMNIFIVISVQAQEPLDVYKNYDDKVKKGLSFDEQQAFFTSRKNSEVRANLKEFSAQMNKTVEEVTKIMLNVAQRLAYCEKVTFVSQNIVDNTATLIFDLEDTCNTEKQTELLKQTVLLIREEGWKIDNIEIE